MSESSSGREFLGLRTAIYRAPELDKAKAWYSNVLGIAPYFDQPFYVGFNVGGYELGLDPDPSSCCKSCAPQRASDAPEVGGIPDCAA